MPLTGERNLHFRVRDKEFRCDTSSFFQVNTAGAEELVKIVEGCLPDDRAGALLDLYSGVGLFAVCLGHRFERVVASEADVRAVRHLKHNLKKNHVRGESRAQPAEVALQGEPEAEIETIIVDPPRAGLSKDVRKLLVKRRPRRIISVSCDPATAARDCASLVEAGWKLERLVAVDLFPVTAQVETVALLVRE